MEFSLLSSSFLMLVIFSFIQLHKPTEASDERYEKCKKPLQCGSVNNITYPFYDDQDRPAYCGYPGFKLNCSDDAHMPEISMTSSQIVYYLLKMDPTSHTVTVAIDYFWDTYSFCPQSFSDNSLNFTLYKYTPTKDNITLYYECSLASTQTQTLWKNQFTCTGNAYNYFTTSYLEYNGTGGYFDPTTAKCKSNYTVPVYPSAAESTTNAENLQAAFRGGFELEWLADNKLCDDCRGSNGECGYNNTTTKFTCYCPDGPRDFNCHGTSSPFTSLDYHFTMPFD